MSHTRREFISAIAALPLAAADEWTQLYNGRSLEGWRPSENKASWKIVDGCLAAEGPRSHLFYDGPVHNADFRNFELEVEALAHHACNSGVYFHTKYQESNFPQKGFEIQINNTYVGEGSYQERKKGGSLYGLRNVYKQFVPDDQWFKIHVLVRGKNVQIRLNGALLVDYTEPNPPIIPDGMERERFLDHGTFALQCHNEGSRALFRSVRVRPLPDNTPTPGPIPVADDLFRQIIDIGRHNIPMADFHVHLDQRLTLEQALAKSRHDGIAYGIVADCGKGHPIANDAALRKFYDTMKAQPCFVAIQADDPEWTKMFSRSTAGLFDYVLADAMTVIHGPAPADKQKFMDMLVDRTVAILDSEPIDILASPTFLPAPLSAEYETLWTEERRRKVIDAAVRNNVALEINGRYKLPSASFITMAKSARAKFVLGTGNSGPSDLGRCEYGIRMIDACKLVWQDFFVPGYGPKAVERKPNAFKA